MGRAPARTGEPCGSSPRPGGGERAPCALGDRERAHRGGDRRGRRQGGACIGGVAEAQLRDAELHPRARVQQRRGGRRRERRRGELGSPLEVGLGDAAGVQGARERRRCAEGPRERDLVVGDRRGLLDVARVRQPQRQRGAPAAASRVRLALGGAPPAGVAGGGDRALEVAFGQVQGGGRLTAVEGFARLVGRAALDQRRDEHVDRRRSEGERAAGFALRVGAATDAERQLGGVVRRGRLVAEASDSPLGLGDTIGEDQRAHRLQRARVVHERAAGEHRAQVGAEVAALEARPGAVGLVARHPARDRDVLDAADRLEDRGDVGVAVARVRARRQHDDERQVAGAAGELGEHLQRGAVGPLGIVHEQGDGSVAGDRRAVPVEAERGLGDRPRRGVQERRGGIEQGADRGVRDEALARGVGRPAGEPAGGAGAALELLQQGGLAGPARAGDHGGGARALG